MREKYESLSLAALRDIAKARKLKGVSTMKKSELIELMLEQDEKDKAIEVKEEIKNEKAGVADIEQLDSGMVAHGIIEVLPDGYGFIRSDVINMIGGGIQSKLLCQMTAGANGRKVIAGPVEATALGNIAVQLMALGEIKDVKEARQIIADSETTYEYLPQDTEKWNTAYEKFKTFIH